MLIHNPCKTEEERKEVRRNYLRNYRNNLSPERKELLLAQNREYHKSGRRKYTPEQKLRIKEYYYNVARIRCRKKWKESEEYRIKKRLKDKKWRDNNPLKIKLKQSKLKVYRKKTIAIFNDIKITPERKYSLKTNYGLTVEQFQNMLKEQNCCCAICSKKLENNTIHVDHNHSTGQVRSLLCPHCNYLLGFSKDNPMVLRMAINYLSKWEYMQDIAPKEKTIKTKGA